MNYKQNKKSLWLFLLVVLLSLMIVMITPEIITWLLFNDTDKIAVISYGKTFILFLSTFIIAFSILFALFFMKWLLVKIIMAIIGLALIIYINVVAIEYSIYFSEEYIEYKQLFDQKEIYEWSKITKVFHELPTDVYKEKYIFEFSNGKLFEFVVPESTSTEIKDKINEKVKSLDASIEEY